jgi:O-methyltransferase
MAVKRIIKKVLRKLGYKLMNSSNPELLDLSRYEFYKDAMEASAITKNHTMLTEVNKVTLYEQVVYCEKNNIPGSFVECGVWKGGAVGIMALANLKYGQERRNMILFDAFDDICEPDPSIDGKKALEDVKMLLNKDDLKVTGKREPMKGIYDNLGGHGTIGICNDLLVNTIKYPKEKIVYFEGWFEDTMEENAKNVGEIAILRLDGDWYSSTKVCLENLFDKVVPGGVVIIDDYGFYEGCSKAVNEFLKKKNIKTFLSYSDYSCRYFIKSA